MGRGLHPPRVTVWNRGVAAGRSPGVVGPHLPSGHLRCPRDTEDPAQEGSMALGMVTAPGQGMEALLH